jgi:hypothetical protein
MTRRFVAGLVAGRVCHVGGSGRGRRAGRAVRGRGKGDGRPKRAADRPVRSIRAGIAWAATCPGSSTTGPTASPPTTTSGSIARRARDREVWAAPLCISTRHGPTRLRR